MATNKWYIKLSLSVLTGLILSLAWYVRGAAFLIMLAFVPLFWLSDISLKEGKRNAFGRGILLFYPAFFVFNLITTYWIAYCTVPGAAAAVILNALLQTLVSQGITLIAFELREPSLHEIVVEKVGETHEEA